MVQHSHLPHPGINPFRCWSGGRNRPAFCLSFLFLLGQIISPVSADVRLPAIFSDRAVLQKADKVPVWGWAEPGEAVQVTLGDASAKGVGNKDGKWKAVLDLSASGPGPFDLVVRGKNEIKISDVLVGEVWLCSGQSNMEMRLSSTLDKKEMTTAANRQLRHFKVEKSYAESPREDVKGQWITAEGAAAGDFTGVGYYFGKKLGEELKVPVGIINASSGGSMAEAWMSPEALAADPEIAKRAAELKAVAKPVPIKTPSWLYNAMLSPVIPYAIKGVLWYQGESNAGSGLASLYRKLLPAMVGDWRTRWGRGDFPFYSCQLANYQIKRVEPGLASTWAELREAQAQSCEDMPNAGVAILIDTGEEKTIHPVNKKDPGERLARIALAKDYGRKVAYSGPTLASASFADGKAILKFHHVDGGLVAAPLPDTYQPLLAKPDVLPLVRNSPGSELEGFLVCGEDRKWVWANAKIAGDAVVVSAPGVSTPVAVRYAWENNPTCNLYNGEGLPAGPFRTDNFPLTSRPNKPSSPEQNGRPDI